MYVSPVKFIIFLIGNQVNANIQFDKHLFMSEKVQIQREN